MSTRERWIVYPLLFLTLGIAMRNQFLPTKKFGAMDLKAADITAQTVHCNNIEVMQDGIVHNNLLAQDVEFKSAHGDAVHAKYSESIQAKFAEADCRKFTVIDEQGKPVVGMAQNENTKAGVIQTMLPSGAPQVQIFSNATGGVVNTVGHLGQVHVTMGQEGELFGVFAQFPQSGRPAFPITSPFRFQLQPPAPKKSEATSQEDKKKEVPKKEDSVKEPNSDASKSDDSK
jgi:hypothetical protein